jgi:predicted negative regulator of RcsB-dependent stress response
MAFEVLDEHEQGEQVQKWLRENALSILIGIGLGLVMLFGWQQWRTHRAQHQMDASAQFNALIGDVDKKDYDAAKAIAAKLKSDYSDTPYAVLAAMREADIASARGDGETAYSALDWAWQHADIDGLKAVAGLNLARVQIARNKAQEALDLLDKLPKGGFEAAAAELRGDALVALNKQPEARVAYAEALKHLEPTAPNRGFVEMKLNDIAAADSTAESTGAEKKGS